MTVSAPSAQSATGARAPALRALTRTRMGGLLAQTDPLHGTLSGLATQQLMERAFSIFGETRYQRWAAISVAPLYNLRQRRGYVRVRQVWTKTRPVNLRIGECAHRRVSRPAPNNRPGSPRAWTACIKAIRMASKAAITSTPWTASPSTKRWRAASASATPFSSEVLEDLLQSFPFVILGFHRDNGSAYLNAHAAKWLNKLLAETIPDARGRQRKRSPLQTDDDPQRETQIPAPGRAIP